MAVDEHELHRGEPGERRQEGTLERALGQAHPIPLDPMFAG